jgi:hypothetical protein
MLHPHEWEQKNVVTLNFSQSRRSSPLPGGIITQRRAAHRQLPGCERRHSFLYLAPLRGACLPPEKLSEGIFFNVITKDTLYALFQPGTNPPIHGIDRCPVDWRLFPLYGPDVGRLNTNILMSGS